MSKDAAISGENGGNGGGPRIAWGDLAITVAVSGLVIALLLTPFARRFWLPESTKPTHPKGA